MGWRGYIHHPRQTVFFWSQKAACTSLFGFLAEDLNVPKGNKKFFHTNSQPYHKCLEALRKRHYRGVILARHPVTRSISAYLNKFCIYRNKPLLSRDDLEPFAQDLHDFYCAQTGTAPRENKMSFLDFLETVRAIRASVPQRERPINGHWETQVPEFLIDWGFAYDMVLRVESLETDLTTLSRELGMPYTPRQMNRTPLSEIAFEGNLTEVPACEVASYDFSYENFTTEETLKRIQGLYQVDFDVLDYSLKVGPEDRNVPHGASTSHWRVIS